MVALELYPETILALAALVTAVAGVLSAVAALRRTRKDAVRTAEEECIELLRAARSESEVYAKDLHDRRMKEME